MVIGRQLAWLPQKSVVLHLSCSTQQHFTDVCRVIITLVMLQLGGFVIPKSQIWPWWYAPPPPCMPLFGSYSLKCCEEPAFMPVALQDMVLLDLAAVLVNTSPMLLLCSHVDHVPMLVLTK